MVQKLELIKGGGGSIRVGTTGTIGSLMTKELDSMRCTPQAPISTRGKPSTVPVSVSCGVVSSPRKLKPIRTVEDPSSSGSSSSSNGKINYKYSETTPKTRPDIRKKTHHIPMLDSEGTAVDVTPKREKINKKGSNFVEVVDIKCRNPDKRSIPLANRFKKLSFSKLSDTIN